MVPIDSWEMGAIITRIADFEWIDITGVDLPNLISDLKSKYDRKLANNPTLDCSKLITKRVTLLLTSYKFFLSLSQVSGSQVFEENRLWDIAEDELAIDNWWDVTEKEVDSEVLKYANAFYQSRFWADLDGIQVESVEVCHVAKNVPVLIKDIQTDVFRPFYTKEEVFSWSWTMQNPPLKPRGI